MISIVICSTDIVRYDAVTEQFRLALGNEPYEIIRIPNARSMCEGYNRGLSISTGEIVIFCHDDIELWSPHFAQRLHEVMAKYDVIGAAGTNRLMAPGWIAAGPPHIFGIVPHWVGGLVTTMVFGAQQREVTGIQALDGLFLAFRRPVIEQLRWDEKTFTHFHCYDVDCTYRAYRAGYRLAVVNDLMIMHMSGGSFDDTWAEQAARLKAKHQLGRQEPNQFARIALDYPTRERAKAAIRAYCASLP